MPKWNSLTNINGASTSVDDKLLLSDESAAAGSRDRNINVGELAVAANRFVVGETAHGLSVGDCVWFDGTNYVEATADTISNARLIGVIVEVPDVDTLVIQQGGFAFGLSGLVAGSTYYLQDAGGLGTSAGSVVVPVLVAVTSATAWVILGTQEGADYEQGTWTPTFTDGTNDGTYTTQVGNYTRIGDTVYITGYLNILSPGSVGSARVGGLPFAIGASDYPSFAFGSGRSLASTAGYNLSGYGSPNDAYFSIARWDSSAGETQATGAEISAGGNFRFNGFYRV